MKLHYYPETDSLCIELQPEASVDSLEMSAGIMLDVDAAGNPVGIDIDGASRRLDLTSVETIALPVAVPAA